MRDQAVARHKRPRERAPRAANPALPRRRRRVSFAWVPRALTLLTYSVVLILTVWLLYYSVESPYFQIKQIDVSGTSLADVAQIQDFSAVSGENALLVRPSDVEKSVLKLSVVHDVKAEVTLTGRASVTVTERTPLVQWQAREGSFLVDSDGVAFSRQASSAPLVAVRDLDGPAMEVGSRVDTSVVAALESLQAALPSRAGFSPTGYDYSRATGVSVQMPDGPRILFGDGDDLDSKLVALATVRQHLDAIKTRAESIDLRFKGRPTYVIAPSTPASPGQTR